MDKISSSTVTQFVKTFLLERYDNPTVIPSFHKEMWDLALSGEKRVAIAAPRQHAKSTAITHALTLFLFLFRLKKYGLIVSDTEQQASLFLGDIKTELTENTAIRELFGIKSLIKDAVTDIIVECNDGYKFRIQAIGAEQKVRGRKWDNFRPDYIVVDDLENDELVESDERRDKLRNWFFKALVPCLSKQGSICMVGTILHMDSVLMRLMKNKSWKNKLYKAHAGFDDFTELLWPEYWTPQSLFNTRQEFIDDGYPEGYSQEYLNDPVAHSEAYFKREDMLAMDQNMREEPTTNYAAVDFAISDENKAAYTVIVVGGMDSSGRLIIKHVARFRGDGDLILTTIFEIQRLYNIVMWEMEKGQILQTLLSEMYRRMNETNVFLNIDMGTPTKDKRSRARAIQARMRAGGVYFDKEASWWPGFEEELIQFPKGTYKDQVDAISWLGIIINKLQEAPTREEIREDEYEHLLIESDFSFGRNATTGY